MIESHTIRWSFKSSNVVNEGRVLRIAIYLQTKVLEIIDSNDSVFYLIYFKNQLLGGGPKDQPKENTFLHTAFQHGIILAADHPLFQVFLPKNRKVVIPDPKTLFTELQNQFSLQDIALAATFMDSIIEKQELVRIIREIHNHFKRNGQFHKAYDISRILIKFSPNTKAIQDLTRAAEFEKYRNIKEEENIWFKEVTHFVKRKEKENEIQLHHLLKQQSRNHERLVLFIELFELNHDFYDYQEFINLLHHELNSDVQYATLKYLSQYSQDHALLRQDLFDEQIHLKQYSEAIALVINQSPPLSANQRQQIEKILEDADPSSLSKVPKINHLISRLYASNPEKKEILVRNLSASLLKQAPISHVSEWLKPIEESTPHLPILLHLRRLKRLSNDLDQLGKLGEAYFELGLLDQAIEYFTWETELHPNSIDPVRWLTRLYQEKGLLQEAESYRKLAILMAKNG